MSPPRIDLLLGKPPRPHTPLHRTIELLGQRDCHVVVHLPHQQMPAQSALHGSDLVVIRGVSSHLEQALRRVIAGVPRCLPSLETRRVLRDRLETARRLGLAGLPVPPGFRVERWEQLAAEVAARPQLITPGTPVVCKAENGPGRGRSVVAGTVPEVLRSRPFEAPIVVQPLLPHDGWDRKIYLVGQELRGLLKPSTLLADHQPYGSAWKLPPEWAVLARRASRALAAEVVGIDVIATPDGPVIVDVNDFPGYRDIDDAPQLLAEHLLSRARAA